MHMTMSRDEMDLDGNDNVSPYSERATPPYLVWARDLQYILNDYEGMKLFETFLTQINAENELTFWYACEGLKKLSKERIAPTAKSIFTDFIRTQGEKCLQCISAETRKQTRSAIFGPDVSEHVFDFVQGEVEFSLRKRHEEFVQSDTYLLYLQSAQACEGMDSATYYGNDSPNSSSNSSSNSGDVLRPTSSLLPTVHEEVEFESMNEKLARYSDADTIRIDEEYDSSMMNDAMHNRTTTGAAADASSSTTNTLTRDDRKQQRPPSSATKRDADSAAVLRDYNNQSTTGEKRKQAQTASQKLTHSTLVKTLGQRMHSAIPATHKPGMPPHPYHTTKTYVPHLNTSAQDSELQSMSSDAATESSVSGTNFRYNDRSVKKYSLLNSEKEDFIPRTHRNEPPPRNMTDEKFREEVVQKLDTWLQSRKKDEKLRDVLKTVAEPENQPNSHRAAVEQFSKVEKAAPDNAESILDDHCTRIGWQDTPPVRSPGFASAGRRRSPGSKSPDRRVSSSNRMMTASYPVTFNGAQLQLLPQNQQGFFGGGNGGRPMMPIDQNNLHWTTQSAMLPQNQTFSGSPRHRSSGNAPSHSASNTLHRHAKLTPDAQMQMQIDFNLHLTEKQRSLTSTRPKFPPAHHPAFSDTSGISSSTSTQVSTDPSVFCPNISSGAKPKCRSTGTVPLNANIAPKPHKTTANPKTNSADKSKMQKYSTAELNVHMRKMNIGVSGATTTNIVGGGRPAAATVVDPMMSGTSSGGQNIINVVYMLPNEPTPFLTKVNQNHLTLKQFKGILAKRQGSFKYYFKCSSDNGREVWEEVTNENETVPFHGLFKVEARVVDVVD